MKASPDFPSLPHLLHEQAAENPNRRLYTFLVDGDAEEAHMSCGELDAQAQRVALLVAKHVTAGDRALLVYSTGLEFPPAFFGCLYAGVIAVPTSPPRFRENAPEATLDRLIGIVRDCKPKVILTTVAIHKRMQLVKHLLPELQDIPVLTTDGETAPDAAVRSDWTPSAFDENSVAFLQYTSGSTGNPKGVMVSHYNIVNNERQIAEAMSLTKDTVLVGWLPLHHDMGLLGVLLQAIYCGGTCVFMSPISFLHRPIRWLRALSKYRGTYSPAPDFAYRLCIDMTKPEELEGLDLSAWRNAMNGAEPVRLDTLDRFTAKFKDCGFVPEQHSPCYGLAEATLMVSVHGESVPPAVMPVNVRELERGVIATDPTSSHCFVSSGGWPDDAAVAIVNPETCERAEPNHIGEIWASGPGIASGYWGREDNDETFRAQIPGSDEKYLRTGDLGFIHGDMLFVTGRRKDMIIIQGLNHYPQDLEYTVEACHDEFRPRGCAAFAVDEGDRERLVIVLEVERTARKMEPKDAAQAVRKALAAKHEIVPDEVVLLLPGRLPKTTSGKKQRSACRSALADGSLQILGRIRFGQN